MSERKLSPRKELVLSLTKKDFRVDFYRGSGPGGQNRNKRDNSCRITHVATGISACAEDSKSQSTNKRNAFRKLVKLLMPVLIPKEKKVRVVDPQKNTRTYNECTDRVKDHLTGDTFSYRNTVGKGDISEIIEARKEKWKKKIK